MVVFLKDPSWLCGWEILDVYFVQIFPLPLWNVSKMQHRGFAKMFILCFISQLFLLLACENASICLIVLVVLLELMYLIYKTWSWAIIMSFSIQEPQLHCRLTLLLTHSLTRHNTYVKLHVELLPAMSHSQPIFPDRLYTYTLCITYLYIVYYITLSAVP